MRRKLSYKFVCLFTSVVLLISLSPVAVNAGRTTAAAVFSDIGITINGEKYDMRPVIINGSSYFPVRTISYALNCKTNWIADTKSIIIESVSEKVGEDTFEQGSGEATAIFEDAVSLTANGKKVDTPIAIINDRSYVPIKKVAEAMGKRATWYEDTRTIQIVNPQTAEVDDDIKDYYVYDLPEIKTQEDYLVGNWRGYINTWADFKYEYFISKNADGTYKVIVTQTLTNDPSGKYDDFIGAKSINECTGIYDSEEYKLIVTNAKAIHLEEPFVDDWEDDTLILDGDILTMPYEENIKNMEDFRGGELIRF